MRDRDFAFLFIYTGGESIYSPKSLVRIPDLQEGIMKIDIAAISLDVENFRHGNVSSQHDAISKLLSDESTHGVADLAEDIVERKGLDPSSLLIVTGDAANPGQYIALEGNRRMTALKTLTNPSLAANLPTYERLKNLVLIF